MVFEETCCVTGGRIITIRFGRRDSRAWLSNNTVEPTAKPWLSPPEKEVHHWQNQLKIGDEQGTVSEIMKSTPKSCSCRTCRKGKGTALQKRLIRLEERAFRRGVKKALRAGQELSQLVPYGSYRD